MHRSEEVELAVSVYLGTRVDRILVQMTASSQQEWVGQVGSASHGQQKRSGAPATSSSDHQRDWRRWYPTVPCREAV